MARIDGFAAALLLSKHLKKKSYKVSAKEITNLMNKTDKEWNEDGRTGIHGSQT